MPFYRLTTRTDPFFHATVQAHDPKEALDVAARLTEWEEDGPYPDIVDIDSVELVDTSPPDALTEHTESIQ